MKRLFGLTITASIFSCASPWRRSPRELSNSASDMSSLYADASSNVTADR